MNTLEREYLHVQIMSAISTLKEGGFKIGPKNADALYRMACVGAYVMHNDADLKRCITTGKLLTNKTWQELLGDDDG